MGGTSHIYTPPPNPHTPPSSTPPWKGTEMKIRQIPPKEASSSGTERPLIAPKSTHIFEATGKRYFWGGQKLMEMNEQQLGCFPGRCKGYKKYHE